MKRKRKPISDKCVGTMVHEMITEAVNRTDAGTTERKDVVNRQDGSNANSLDPSAEPFQFESIADFDARKGYRPCASRGVTAHLSDGRHADASLWRDSAGNVVARFSSSGYRFSFVVRRDSGPVQDNELVDLESYLSELLYWWMVEGIDDQPTTELAILKR
jgi:hypothetical protein